MAYDDSQGAGTDTTGVKLPDGIDPRLAALYTKVGMTPGDRGTGFSDWQYWQDKMNSGDRPADYYLNRLGDDLNGTGTDQPTGTIGQGPWSKSGAGQPAAGGGGGPVTAPPPSMALPSPQTGYGPSMNTPNSFWQGRSAQDLANSTSGISNSGNSDPTGILAALMKRIGLNSAGIQFNKG